jgi:hypothetical protein
VRGFSYLGQAVRRHSVQLHIVRPPDNLFGNFHDKNFTPSRKEFDAETAREAAFEPALTRVSAGLSELETLLACRRRNR